jgi:hypothetical protein
MTNSNIVKDIESITKYKLSLSKKGDLVARDDLGKLVPATTLSAVLSPIENMNPKQFGNLVPRLTERLNENRSIARSMHTSSYDSDYLDKLSAETFVVTQPASPARGYKLSQYPSGDYKVGKTFQSIEYKRCQLGLHLLPAGERGQDPFQTLYALETYAPFNREVLFHDKGKEDYFLNMYRPSMYMERYYGFIPSEPLLPIHTFDELDPVVQAYFIHLLPDKSDRVYLLQWLAFSLFEHCETIPLLFGNGGTGKTILSNIWARMLGNNNWAPMNASALDGEFSMAHFVNKRGVSVNEGKITSPQQMENLKNSTDNYIRVNDKNEKFKTIRKTHSLMYTANHLDSIKGMDFSNERRFSFLGVTDDRLANKEIKVLEDIVVKFDKDTLDRLNPSEELEDEIHELTFNLFSFLANIYKDGNCDPIVKSQAHVNRNKAKTIVSASSPNWFVDMMEVVLSEPSNFTAEEKFSGYSHYITIGDLQDAYRIECKPKIVPGCEPVIAQFDIRQKTNEDVLVKRGKTAKITRIYFKDDLYKDLVSK